MKVKIINKLTNEFEVREVLEFTETSIKEQAGKGIMYVSYDSNEYEVKEYNEQENENQ